MLLRDNWITRAHYTVQGLQSGLSALHFHAAANISAYKHFLCGLMDHLSKVKQQRQTSLLE